jgi:hypothetical protein
VVTDVVHVSFEQALIETVIGLQQLKGSKEWGAEQMDVALSEEALTATVMQRYHVHNQCRRDLGANLVKHFKRSSAKVCGSEHNKALQCDVHAFDVAAPELGR